MGPTKDTKFFSMMILRYLKKTSSERERTLTDASYPKYVCFYKYSF